MLGSNARGFIALLAAATLAACGSDKATAPAAVTVPPIDLTAVLSQLSLGGLDNIPSVASLLGLPTSLASPTVVPASCTYAATSHGFACPTVSAQGVSFDLTYYLYDAAGQPQSQTSGINTTTASIRTVTDSKGTLTLPNLGVTTRSAAIVSHSDNTMSGLLATNAMLNGTSTVHYDLTTSGPPVDHAVVDVTSATSNVVLPARTAPSPSYPLSGTLTSDVKNVSSSGILAGVTTSARLAVTFNGTSSPPATITVAGITRTCKIDLSGHTAPTCS